MSSKYIRLQEANCRNCLRCVRVCPTKAMTYQNHQPQIVTDECILCGNCYSVCPHSAKKVVTYLPKIKQWLNNGEDVYLSVAPSFASVWPSFPSLKQNLLDLGFKGVEETALGAKEVSKVYNRLLKEGKMRNIITTCCPAVVNLIRKDFPELVDELAPVVSPMVAHAKMIKASHPNAKVVFLTPCIAKQKEADDNSEYVDATITMIELDAWFKTIGFKDIEAEWEDFEGQIARIYPTPGGIISTLNGPENYHFIAIEGVDRVKRTLKAISDGILNGYFFEMSSCIGSCIGGPLVTHMEHNEWRAQSVIRDHIDINQKIREDQTINDLTIKWEAEELPRFKYSEEQINDMLYIMGKSNKARQWDCGFCGYETCRDKAIAVLEGKADVKLCLPDALERARSISNVIIENTPNGIIVLDRDLNIREINPSARHMLRLDDINPIGFPILSILPSDELANILNDNSSTSYMKTQYLTYNYPQYKLLLSHAIMKLHQDDMRILILMDLTVEATKEKVIKQMRQQTLEITQNVIDDQMRTVQEIASLLGETTAKSKVALTKLMKAMQEDE